MARVAPYLALASVNGVDTSVPFSHEGWATTILPLNEGDYDVRPYLASLVRHSYTGPILLHNFGFKSKPEEYLPASMKRWHEESVDVAKLVAPEKKSNPGLK